MLYISQGPQVENLISLCHRMCELLQSGEQSGERTQAANSLSTLLSGGSRKRAEVNSLSAFAYTQTYTAIVAGPGNKHACGFLEACKSGFR